jgi:hypothetical protein
MSDDSNQPERPRVEPEIIPPGQGRGSYDWRQSPWRNDGYAQAHGSHRIYVTRMGPFGIALLILAIAAIAAIILIAIVGAVLIWIPVVAVLVIVAAIFRFLSR